MSGDPMRKVLMSSELFHSWGLRTADGGGVTIEWGESDAEGCYTPAFTWHADEGFMAMRDGWALQRLREVAEATPGYRLTRIDHLPWHPKFYGDKAYRIRVEAWAPPDRPDLWDGEGDTISEAADACRAALLAIPAPRVTAP